MAVKLQVACFDPQTSVLSGSYMQGGGCQSHTPKVELTLQRLGTTYPRYEVQINIVDVSPEQDPCEALLYPEFKVDLKTEIKALLEKQSIEAYQVSVKLHPEVTANFPVTVVAAK